LSLILDSSATLAWCFEDEATPVIDGLFNQIAEEGAIVPSLWRLEVGNGLQMAVRRKRLDQLRRDQLLLGLSALEIAVDPDTDRNAWSESLRLSETFQLTLYDACYL
jgi:predicted nucleic acid-binding protein